TAGGHHPASWRRRRAWRGASACVNRQRDKVCRLPTDDRTLTREQVLDAYRTVLRARTLDDRRFVLNRAGKLAFIISPRGHEVAQVAAITALQPGRDRFCLYYRNFAAALACGFTPEELMLSAFARAADPSSGGRQTPGNFGSRRRGVIIGSSTVGPQIPKAAGIGLALKWRGEGALCYVSFGEGATLIEAEVLRLQSHSTDDDQRTYRDAAELAAEAARDPIPRMRDALMQRGWLTAEADAGLREEVNREVERATEAAEAAADPDPGSLGRHVYAD